MASNELSVGDVWKVQATPNDNTVDGNSVMSNNVTIQSAAQITSLVLNSTFGTNLTNENLTAYSTTLFNSTKVFYNWYKNNAPVTIFNMPMDGGTLAEGNTKVRDYALGNNLTLGNGTAGTQPIYNSTGGYDGKGAYEFAPSNFLVSSNNFVVQGNIPRTVSAWIKPHNISGNAMIFAWGNSANGNKFGLFYSGSAYSVWGFGGGFDWNTGVPVTFNQWSFITVGYNGSTTKVYINGILNKTNSSYVFNTGTGPIYVGGTEDYGVIKSFYNGTIDEFIVWNKSLSDQEVSALYNSYLQNKSNNIMVSNELTVGDIWKVQATPNDNTADGTSVVSNNVTIQSTVGITSLILNSTS